VSSASKKKRVVERWWRETVWRGRGSSEEDERRNESVRGSRVPKG
jgi:hypothetical protein